MIHLDKLTIKERSDCHLSTIRQVLSLIGKEISVNKLHMQMCSANTLIGTLQAARYCKTKIYIPELSQYFNCVRQNGGLARSIIRELGKNQVTLCVGPSGIDMRQAAQLKFPLEIHLQGYHIGLQKELEHIPNVQRVIFTIRKLDIANDVIRLKTYINQIRENYAVVEMDPCVKQCIREYSSGNTTGCGAGVDSMTVWNYGHVTGCPYFLPECNPSNRKVSAIINKLSQVGSINEWRRCRIRTAYKIIRSQLT